MNYLIKTITTAVVLGGVLTASAQNMAIDKKTSGVEWLGKKVTGQHSGGISIINGEITMKEGSLAGASVTMNMNSITNSDISDAENSAKLVGHLKSPDFFAVEEFPEATFSSTAVKAVEGEGSNFEITGDLTIKGTTHPITFPVMVEMKDGAVHASGTATFDRTKYDVRYGSGAFFEGLGDKMIYDDVELKFNIMTAAKK